jgi:hypothetical protein
MLDLECYLHCWISLIEIYKCTNYLENLGNLKVSKLIGGLFHIKSQKFIYSSYIWSWNEVPFMALSYGKGYLHVQCLQLSFETKKIE